MQPESGILEVIAGPMFSGKSEELIRLIRRAQIARQRVQVFSHALDTRYGPDQVRSHDGGALAAVPIAGSADLEGRLDPAAAVIAVDEVQFMDHGIARVAERLVARGLRVILAGLDLDFRGEPFGPMGELMARADVIHKLEAVCVVCGRPAQRTQRLVEGRPAPYHAPVILVGAQEAYEARCRVHHEVPGRA
ncbi:MAG TPA: thymidine kinase [bacterium]|jgi:thymidine kinase|nr:thymidine kinase [bacterium]